MTVTPQPMETAPKDGGWVLGLVLPDGPTDACWQPWEFVTWGDDGWYDDEGYQTDPTAWVPIPDPQPRNTGWMPAEGSIYVEEITGEGWTDGQGNPVQVPYRWAVYVIRPDGSYDEYRDTDHRSTKEGADIAAQRLAEKTGLPIVEVPLPAAPSNVVSISSTKLTDGGQND